MPENWPTLHPSSKRSNSPVSNPVEGKDFPTNNMVHVEPEKNVELGKPHDFPSFGWDNEYGERSMSVPPFMASEFMVTNGEFWHFVADGGYRKQEYWCDDGWNWRTHRNMKWPFFWEPDGPQVNLHSSVSFRIFLFVHSFLIFFVKGSHEYNMRTIFDIIPIQWDWPVDVNYYEAKAFCRWKVRE